jgi:hypothetical protein
LQSRYDTHVKEFGLRFKWAERKKK